MYIAVRPRAGGAVQRHAGAARRRHRSASSRPPTSSATCADRRRRRVRSIVDNLRKAKVDPRVKAVLLKPTGFESPFWAQGAGGARRGARLQEVGQAGLRVSRVRRRSRVLPGDRGRQGVPDAVDAARSRRRRDLRAVSPRHARQDRRVSRSAPHRPVQDRGQHLQGKGLHRRAQGDGRVDEPRSVRADRAGHRRRPQEERSRGAHARSTRGRFCRRTRCAPAWSTRWPTRIRWTTSCAPASSGAISTATTTRASAWPRSG